MRRLTLCTIMAIILTVSTSGVAPFQVEAQWTARDAPVMTRWAEDVSPDSVHPEYPRPQMVRTEWQNLNGLWEYAITPRNSARPAEWHSGILVPFPVESALSGVMERIDADQRLWYRRSFTLPGSWTDKRVLLHFGAVDWETMVQVNGRMVGEHRGGYDPFTIDISSALQPGSEQEIVVAVWDPTSSGYQARGKQVDQPRGIWYTPTTGIWRTVWLEPVPEYSIERLHMVPDIDRERLVITADVPTTDSETVVEVLALDGTRVVSSMTSRLRSCAMVPRSTR